MENIIKYEFSKTTRGKKQIIIDRKFKFNFSYKSVVTKLITFRCTHYKTHYQCPSHIVLNDKDEIIYYESKQFN